MTKRQAEHEGAQFLRYFGPLLDALRKLGGSGAPTEVVEQIALDLGISEEARTTLLDWETQDSQIRLHGHAST